MVKILSGADYAKGCIEAQIPTPYRINSREMAQQSQEATNQTTYPPFVSFVPFRGYSLRACSV
jgi:hypothetical protein